MLNLSHTFYLQENRELHEIIMTLKDEKDMKINELKELRKVISAVENQNIEALQNQVLSLSTQVTKLERNLNAKQVFCETIVTENEAMKNELQSLKDDRILKVRDVKKELGDLMKTTEVREIMQQVYENQDGEPEVCRVWGCWILYFSNKWNRNNYYCP